MRLEIIVRPEAVGDAADAAHWYDARITGLGLRFLEKLDQAIISAAEKPAQFLIYLRDIRRIRLQVFPMRFST